jgi:hypothetical protein
MDYRNSNCLHNFKSGVYRSLRAIIAIPPQHRINATRSFKIIEMLERQTFCFLDEEPRYHCDDDVKGSP